ncbi:hypothetical protein CGC20_18915 [Leishmania donovani]|uniref:Uncharacterized protein n=1 Tax=Leishmania donovani TaxID=5661 RepID=A0A504XL01_LEIDO|nr:hypothetical protein CGC20_18915 [Leishmania donovani]
MLEFLLRGYLMYLSFVQPVIYGAQLCRSPDPDALQVTNVTLTLIFAWLLEVYERLFSSLVDTYFPVIDSVVARHVQTICNSGLTQYGAQVCIGLLRGIAAAAGIAKTLMEVSSTTTVRVAPLPRRMSQERGGGEVEDARISPPPRPPPATRSVPLELPSLFYDNSDER